MESKKARWLKWSDRGANDREYELRNSWSQNMPGELDHDDDFESNSE